MTYISINERFRVLAIIESFARSERRETFIDRFWANDSDAGLKTLMILAASFLIVLIVLGLVYALNSTSEWVRATVFSSEGLIALSALLFLVRNGCSVSTGRIFRMLRDYDPMDLSAYHDVGFFLSQGMVANSPTLLKWVNTERCEVEASAGLDPDALFKIRSFMGQIRMVYGMEASGTSTTEE